MTPLTRTLAVLLLVALGAVAAWAMVGTGFANYDTAYALLWGADLAHGRVPDYEVTLAPTPHPLATLAGLVLAPLGDGAETAVVVAAFAWLGALGAVAFALGAQWFGPAAGALGALILLTREPVLSFGARAYVDLPYVVLVLAAVALEARRPRAGAPVLALLALAGLLRPEAWLLSGAYLAWLALGPEASRGPARALARLAALAAAAPVLWALSDLLVTGSPLHSLTGTREGAEVLQRRTGLDDVPVTVPRRLGEILREPVLLGAAVGGVLLLALQRERARLPLAVGVAALVAFCVLAAAGLPILGRYLLLPAALLALVCGAGALGWRTLAAGHPWRGRWRAAGIVVLLALAAFTPRQVERIDDLRAALRIQREIRDDLRALVAAPAFPAACAPLAVPNHRPVPHLALWLDRPPRAFVSARLATLRRGVYLDPATARVERNYILDPNDPVRTVPRVPPGFRALVRNRSWVAYASCPRSLRSAR